MSKNKASIVMHLRLPREEKKNSNRLENVKADINHSDLKQFFASCENFSGSQSLKNVRREDESNSNERTVEKTLKVEAK